jgi:hypothetical protein
MAVLGSPAVLFYALSLTVAVDKASPQETRLSGLLWLLSVVLRFFFRSGIMIDDRRGKGVLFRCHQCVGAAPSAARICQAARIQQIDPFAFLKNRNVRMTEKSCSAAERRSFVEETFRPVFYGFDMAVCQVDPAEFRFKDPVIVHGITAVHVALKGNDGYADLSCQHLTVPVVIAQMNDPVDACKFFIYLLSRSEPAVGVADHKKLHIAPLTAVFLPPISFLSLPVPPKYDKIVIEEPEEGLMPNTMKIITRTLIVVALMIAGAWLSATLGAKGGSGGQTAEFASVIVYIVYFAVGIGAGSMVSPRFTKQKNKFVYLFPVIIFVIIGIAPLAYSVFALLPFPVIGSYLSQFSLLSWALSGLFFTLAFR